MNNKHFIGKNVLRQKTNICCFVDLLLLIGVNSFLSFTKVHSLSAAACRGFE